MRTVGTIVMLGAALTGCSVLADDSSKGNFGTLRGQLIGPMPADPPHLAIVWVGVHSVHQEVTGAMTGNGFVVTLTEAPPSGTQFADPSPGDDFDGEYAVPSHAEGFLVAYADGNGNGKLDPCVGASCADQVLGTSSTDFMSVFDVPPGSEQFDEAAQLTAAYTDSPSTILYVPTAWKPYGVAEIPAGYAVSRKKPAADGRIINAFDPTMNIEVPMSTSRWLDQLTCIDSPSPNAFTFGDPDCPDVETIDCTRAPEMPPADAIHEVFEQCIGGPSTGPDGGDTPESCYDVWSKVEFGCSFAYTQWNSCPVPVSESGISWSCM